MSSGTDESIVLLRQINTNLSQLETKMDSIVNEDYKKLKKEVEDLKEYRIRDEAKTRAQSGLITAMLKHWGGIITILTILVLGALELKKMAP